MSHEEQEVSSRPAAEKRLSLHTILLQNNELREIPPVLEQIPSLRVIQLHGNPCVNNKLFPTWQRNLSKQKTNDYEFGAMPPPKQSKYKF